ncbi:hypothetical protein TUM3794_20140 [Shewanella colwelliana]|uniref:Lipocalin-like domain-containing protein n=1 Tax=Shewanella colwelliana TaxID=23 RepID=A0ABQ4P1A3_SHECO|nr:hypothetical protein [Shewanella colwelliana]GIU40952.1 hypothetical protein TUM3794_20140 [Shewanella colwelliana]
MNLKKFTALVGMIGAAVCSVYFFNKNVEEDAVQMVTGNWVASELICNERVDGIIGMDLDDTSMLVNGAKYDVDHYQVERIDNEFTCGAVGKAHFIYKVTMQPAQASIEVGELNDFAVIRNETGQVYFKLTPEFKAFYDDIRAKG